MVRIETGNSEFEEILRMGTNLKDGFEQNEKKSGKEQKA